MADTDSRRPGDDPLAQVTRALSRPLTIARGFTRDLVDLVEEPDRRGAVRAIARNLTIALHLLETYRAATRGDDPITLETARLSVAELVDGTVDDLDTLLDDHAVDVRHDDARLEVVADGARLRQTLFNLLSNAVAHTPPGTAIHVRTWERGGDVTIEVADEGEGVAREDAEAIFEPRRRGDTDAAGLGLGLHVARTIADAHGGRLELVPGEDVGAVFRLTLPGAGTDAG